MEWHAGKTLSQSVFTILFVHHLPDINPEYLAPEEDADLARPRWLVTVVVRAGVLGMLKCCDLAWRELSKNRVHDVSIPRQTTCATAQGAIADRSYPIGDARLSRAAHHDP